MRYSFLLFLLPLAFASCLKKELPVPAHDPGDIITAAVEMGSDYRYQVYYNLSEKREVGRSLRAAWDLGFEAGPGGFRVVLNGGKLMFAAPAKGGNLSTLTAADTAGFSNAMTWDASSGNMDSTVIGDWRKGNGMFLIERGFDQSLKPGGVYKIRIRSVDETGYDVEYGPLDSKTPIQLRVKKDSAYNFTYLNLDSAATTMIEPPHKDWDLVFTQYTHTFHEPAYQPYLVSGVLLNPARTLAYVADKALKFSGITIADMDDSRLSKHVNTIGYDWKVFTGATYVTNADRNFFILDQRGFRYKLHFIDFINASGVKGNPKWEFQTL